MDLNAQSTMRSNSVPSYDHNETLKRRQLFERKRGLDQLPGCRILDIYVNDLMSFRRCIVNFRLLNAQKKLFQNIFTEKSFTNYAVRKGLHEKYDAFVMNYLNSVHAYIESTRRLYKDELSDKSHRYLKGVRSDLFTSLEYTICKKLRNVIQHDLYLPVGLNIELSSVADGLSAYSWYLSAKVLSSRDGFTSDEREYIKAKSEKNRFNIEPLIKDYQGSVYTHTALRRKLFFRQYRDVIKEYLKEYSKLKEFAKEVRLSSVMNRRPDFILLFELCLTRAERLSI